MPDRSFIEWDKDDIEDLGIFKVDVLALGMLTCIKKGFDLLEKHYNRLLTLATVPQEDSTVYDMLCQGDSIGVFQVESRAQMNMLPRLQPRKFYDLVVEVAIVRPGPIQGNMVHPYLKRRKEWREGKREFHIPGPAPEFGPSDELSSILKRTFGVPIFQEQAMQIARDAAKFTPAEIDRLRKAMATFRSKGKVSALEGRMVGKMLQRGYDPEFSRHCFNQIEGFGEYGFPESHAASFALLVYVSSWLKCHYPTAFAAALLNSQPMGFYAPAQIVRDAEEHGVTVLPADVNHSDWDCTLEKVSEDRPFSKDQWRKDKGWGLRLGLRQVDGFPKDVAEHLMKVRCEGGFFSDVIALQDRASLQPAHIERLAAADCFSSLHLPRRPALWEARTLIGAPELPLFAGRDEGTEKAKTHLPAMPLSEEVIADYQTQRLSLKAHPMSFLRAGLTGRGFLRACDLKTRKHRSMVDAAGIVLIRQRPGSAKGVVFITLEDETGIANLVVWPDTMEKYRKVVMGARLIEVRGRVEYDEDVLHVIAARLTDASHRLHELSDDLLKPAIAHGDHAGPLPPGLPEHFRQGHPRAVRVIPMSGDFH
jgi:error-prone DNA polymerase